MSRFIPSVRSSLFAGLLLLVSNAGSAPLLKSKLFEKVANTVQKSGDQAFDAAISLGQEISRAGDSSVRQVLQGGLVVGQVVIQGGKIVAEQTLKDGKVVATDAVSGGRFIVENGQIVGREVEMDGKVIGTEVIKDGKVIGHTVVAGTEYVVKNGTIAFGTLASPRLPRPARLRSAAATGCSESFAAACAGAS